MTDTKPVVYVVEDDEQMRSLIQKIVLCLDLDCRLFASSEEFIEGCKPESGCIVSDVRMPGMNGVELLESLTQYGIHLPCILITGHGDIPLAVRAMQSNAVDVIEKPFRNIVLLEAIQRALEIDQQNKVRKAKAIEVSQRLAQLTERESEVLEGILEGQANKQMAYKLDVSVKTIEAHRSRLMKKMKSYSVAELVREVTEARHEIET